MKPCAALGGCPAKQGTVNGETRNLCADKAQFIADRLHQAGDIEAVDEVLADPRVGQAQV